MGATDFNAEDRKRSKVQNLISTILESLVERFRIRFPGGSHGSESPRPKPASINGVLSRAGFYGFTRR